MKKMLPILSPSEFVALVNQTLELTLSQVDIVGEVKNFKISKNRWVYFDIADDSAKIRCFGTIYSMPGPIEDGMVVRLSATPRMHPQFGFSLNVQSLQFSGEGTIKKAADLLMAQLEKEGLFAVERKRTLPFPPTRIALVASAESAAYKDFIKVIAGRYGGMQIELADVTVQGDSAPAQIVRAIEWFNKQAEIADVLVVIRGGGSADDLQAFSQEQVVRAVAASRIPTMVAIGHEVDVSLAELAADQRGSTPSNAAELLVPDRRESLERVRNRLQRLSDAVDELLSMQDQNIINLKKNLHDSVTEAIEEKNKILASLRRTLDALSPNAILERGYSIIRQGDVVVKSSKSLKGTLEIQFSDGNIKAEVQ